MFTVGYGDITP